MNKTDNREYVCGIIIALFISLEMRSETLVNIVQKVICTYCVVDLKFCEIEVSEHKQKHKLGLSLKHIGLPIKEIDST